MTPREPSNPLAATLPVIVGCAALAALTWTLIPVLEPAYRADKFLFAVLGAVCAMGILVWPHLGVFAILALWFAQFSPAFLEVEFLRIPYVASAILVVPLCAALLRDRSVSVLHWRHVQILLWIGVLYLTSTAWHELRNPIDVLPAIDDTTRQFQLFGVRLVFLVFFFYFITTRRLIEATVVLLVGVTTVAAIDSWGSLLSGTVTRATASLLDKEPNRLAFVCLFATSIVWFFRTSPRGRRWSGALLPLVFFLPATTLATGSRSGFLQALALAFLAFKEHRRITFAGRVRALAIIACAALVLLAAVPDALLSRATRFDPNVAAPGQESLQNRALQLESAFAFIAGNPLLGVGLGNFEPLSQARHGVRGGAHNSYLTAILDGGIGALALYLWLFTLTYRTLRHVEATAPPDLRWLATALRVGLVVFLIASATGDIWLNEHLYVILALTLVLTRFSEGAARDVAPPVTRTPHLRPAA